MEQQQQKTKRSTNFKLTNEFSIFFSPLSRIIYGIWLLIFIVSSFAICIIWYLHRVQKCVIKLPNECDSLTDINWIHTVSKMTAHYLLNIDLNKPPLNGDFVYKIYSVNHFQMCQKFIFHVECVQFAAECFNQDWSLSRI